MTTTVSPLAFAPLTSDRWGDLERLFGTERGASSGCWCTWFRLTRTDWTALGSAGRKALFHRVVEDGPVPGLLAYAGARPVGWVAVAPRASWPSLARSAISGGADVADWAITCFYVDRAWRGGGLMRALIEAAVAHARAQGAGALDAWPCEPRAEAREGELFVGVAAEFRASGFRELSRPSARRVTMRKELR